MAFKSGDELANNRAWKRAKSTASHDDHGTQIAVGLGWLDHEDDPPEFDLEPRDIREDRYCSDAAVVTLADLVTADVIREAQRIVTVRECLNCRKEFTPDNAENYCNSCDLQWREQHLPALVEMAKQEEAARQQAEIARLATLCITCRVNKKNGKHPYCLPCYLATIPDCETGCGNKANRGFPKCSPCYQQQQAKKALQLDLEARRYHNLGLKGSNGLPANLDYIREHIGYFRHEARIHLNHRLNAKTGASQERAKKDAERRARQLARSISPNRSK